VALLGSQGPSTLVTVRWQVPTAVPGSLPVDVITGALPDGGEQEVSGTLRGFWHQIGASTKLRQFSEIKVGDVLFDIDPGAVVAVYDGQVLVSGTLSAGASVTLDAIATQGVRFELRGQSFVQAEIGDELADAWNVIVGGQALLGTVLLRKAT